MTTLRAAAIHNPRLLHQLRQLLVVVERLEPPLLGLLVCLDLGQDLLDARVCGEFVLHNRLVCYTRV